MSGITSVAFGPNDTWVVCEDSDISWRDLPTQMYNNLDDRVNNHRCAPTNVAAVGHNGDFALFYCGYNWYVNCGDLGDILNNDEIRGDDVKTFSFGDDGSYILLLHNGMTYWSNIHWRLQQLIETRSNASIDWVAIGGNDTYFISYSDGAQYWCGEIFDQIMESNSPPARVWLSPFDNKDYFVEFDDGSSAWVACQSFSNRQHNDKWMSAREILYTNGSISQQFTCGRCIHETAQSLEDGTLAPDDIPCMHVFEYEGYTYSLNNRRLWALSIAGVDSTPVKFVDPPHHVLSKLWNGFEGRSIRLR